MLQKLIGCVMSAGGGICQSPSTFTAECHSRYELHLIRLASFYGLLRSPLPSQLITSQVADGFYHTENTTAFLSCCVCDAKADLRDIIARATLASTTLSHVHTYSVATRIAQVIEAEQRALHNQQCPVFTEQRASCISGTRNYS